jgi:hypothetical protein
MAFEKFTDTGRRSFKPKVSIRKSGVVGFSAATVDKFGLRDKKFMSLYWDAETARIGFQPTVQEEEGSHPLIIGKDTKSGSASASLSASRFLDRFEIAPSKNIRLDAFWDSASKMVIVQLPKDGTSVQPDDETGRCGGTRNRAESLPER